MDRARTRIAALNELAASLAHDLNNPLAVMLANLEASKTRAQALEGALGRGGLPGEAARVAEIDAAITRAAEAGWRVADVVRDVTLLGPAGRALGVDIVAILEAALRLVGGDARANVQFHRDAPPRTVPDVEPAALALAFVDVVAACAGPVVSVGVALAGDDIDVTILGADSPDAGRLALAAEALARTRGELSRAGAVVRLRLPRRRRG